MKVEYYDREHYSGYEQEEHLEFVLSHYLHEKNQLDRMRSLLITLTMTILNQLPEDKHDALLEEIASNLELSYIRKSDI